MSNVAIIAIARLENDYVNEWVGHHLDIGVDHIYIYDNSSSDEEKLDIYEKYLDNVTIIPAYDKLKFQMPAYKEAYEQYNGLYDYLIYIDIDEFIMLQKDEDIHSFLDRLPSDCECYRMNWECYGDNNIVNRNCSSSVIKDFTTPIGIGKWSRRTTTKSIVKCGLKDIDFISVHYAIRNNGGEISNLKTYFGDMQDITDTLPTDKKSLEIQKIDYTFIKLNHYITKSLCEFLTQKLRRPSACRDYMKSLNSDFFIYNGGNPEKLDIISKHAHILTYYYYSALENEPWAKEENAGDYFNKILINKLYFCNLVEINNQYNTSRDIDMVFCGSLLAHLPLERVRYIVGCGFQDSKEPTNKNAESYLAVRGKLTKERLKTMWGINVRDDIVFADPGLLVSMMYDLGEVTKKYKIGIIPHNFDDDMVTYTYGDKYNVISMRTKDIQNLCRRIKECEIILSSSLHGIIFAHALGVPAYHIEMRKLMEGDNFKFKDYYSCYDSDIHYENFKCPDYNIPIDDIIEYDRVNREKCNPSQDDILKKQREFLSVVPYKEYLNEKYKVV